MVTQGDLEQWAAENRERIAKAWAEHGGVILCIVVMVTVDPRDGSHLELPGQVPIIAADGMPDDADPGPLLEVARQIADKGKAIAVVSGGSASRIVDGQAERAIFLTLETRTQRKAWMANCYAKELKFEPVQELENLSDFYNLLPAYD